ncbi:Ubiquitin fusion degradation UFD1 family protein [Arabidopsis thaliana]|uniref:Ubiquitin fusion degradation UFD1 family protein n=4 Tax=Arabidopsis thaliana TaxID=3702 RepID=A0A1P8B7F5_ARATH|nr:Ubiquitin fusion degradation UFD1 family protein [Arabidopsis thaliana]ANM67522.1 Ubiquitin fusion degradation UFD1 family protein [Arabidopsis thaliana]|eukprot:NP_001329347.1 Ubiquitin fusion degradation UFD1 family protein [Arabidopsis thaliana]
MYVDKQVSKYVHKGKQSSHSTRWVNTFTHAQVMESNTNTQINKMTTFSASNTNIQYKKSGVSWLGLNLRKAQILPDTLYLTNKYHKNNFLLKLFLKNKRNQKLFPLFFFSFSSTNLQISNHQKMDFELRSAKEKLEREQRERKQRAKLKLEREKKSKEAAIKQREAIEAAQRARRLDAIEAQIKADQHMQESLVSGDGIVFERVFQAVSFQGNGDKIKLPPSCFTELSDQGAFDKGPLYFELSVVDHADNKKTTHSGVLEFTAEDGTIGLPPHVWSNLFSTHDPMDVPLVEIRYIRLPKGSYAKLQPDNLGFSDLPNHKAILETILRQHATLSLDDVLLVNYGQVSYKLQVLELRPATSISVLETDIEVDIVSPDIVSDQPNQHVLKPLQYGKSESGTVEEGRYDYYKFVIDEATVEKVMAGSVKVIVKVDVEKVGADTDLYVSKHPVLFPSLNQHEWSSHDVGSKTLILVSKERALSSGTYSIGVYGFKGTVKYQVSVLVQESIDGAKVGERAVSSSSDVDTVECRNCKHSIPSRSIALHEVYCSRHNVVCNHHGCGIVLRVEEAKNHLHCEKCGKALQPTEMEKHLKVFHEPLTCGCGIVLEKEQMVQHQGKDCPLRLIACRFCGDMVEAGNSAADTRDRMRGMSEHESTCGSRTAPCDSCGRSVMLKDMDIHQIAVHGKSS